MPEELYQAIIEIYIYFLGYVPSPEEKKKMKKKSKIPDRRSRHGREMFLLLLSGVLLFQWGKIDALQQQKRLKQ